MRRLTPVFALLIPLAGCSDTPSQAPDPTPATVVVTLAKTDLQVGETTTATAVVRDDYDRVLAVPVIWRSNSPTTATVSETGVVTAVLTGTVTITAAAGGRKGVAVLTVVRPPALAVASIEVSFPLDTMALLGAARARAVVRDVSGAVVQRQVRWTSTSPAVASVTNSGFVTAHSGGTATIVGEIEGKADSVTVPVPPVAQLTLEANVRPRVGLPYLFRATTRLADGRVVTRQVNWTSLDPSRAVISQGGQFTALVPGPVSLRATSEGVSIDVAVDSYGWVVQQTPTGWTASIEDAYGITNSSGGVTYPTLVVGCSDATPFLRVDIPYAATGKVTDPYEGGFYYYYTYKQWNVVAGGVTMPSTTTAEFKAVVTNMSVANILSMQIEGTDGGWRSVLFYTNGVHTALAPAAATCPALGP